MASTASILHLCFILFFLLHNLSSAQAKLTLDPSDHHALYLILKDLGIRRHAFTRPCSSSGVVCERRVVNGSHALKVTRIVFESQALTGSLSPSLGSLSHLKQLSLSNNQLVDQIPPELSRCKTLEIVDLRKNQFSGEVPPELSSLVRLRVLDLSSNNFSGNLNFLRNLPSLEKLSLAHNSFSGEVPSSSLRRLRSLRLLNLTGNTLLQGPVKDLEEEYNVLSKRYILAEAAANGTEKAPSGAKPGAVIATAPAPSPEGAGGGGAKGDNHHHKKRNVGEWLLVFLGGAVAGSVAGVIVSVAFKLLVFVIRGRGKNASLAIFSPTIKKGEDLAFLDKPDGLAGYHIIGRGGCGEVYKAELSNGKAIAIKKVIQPPRDAAELAEEDSKLLNKKMRQIRSEIQTVGQIRHRNLLPLLAHLPRPDCHYLVYDYMKNGSLRDILLEVEQGRREFDWLSRHRTAIGIAAGLEYLHMNHTPRIIHRDLKPANVLLDDDMEARITDFGLAKAMPEMYTHVTTSNVAGTVGYIAPEYHQTLKFTDKCDIYSFGVLLGVLVIGKLPTDEFFQGTQELSLVKWMRNVMTSQDPKRAIDPKLIGNGYEEHMLLVLKIACFCTLDNPKERPNSKDVRLMLSQIQH